MTQHFIADPPFQVDLFQITPLILGEARGQMFVILSSWNSTFHAYGISMWQMRVQSYIVDTCRYCTQCLLSQASNIHLILVT